jgi:hypothetical protein
MDGADHMSRSKMPIGRLELHDLKNERPIVHQAAGSDGSESHGVDGLGFPQECFFLMCFLC